ncbi:alanine--tRNA ligase [Rhodohalobacter barkolensis]|uniref:Alanine--tRNA ligase n=1 Tax=Rhodohalobacter barkolensis TaxID=2053187 RepID=A0A2N0VJ05_9BACT|nr:alanine--tRNA ligase [Rhodohalobacter barkolensis]PKD44177.1 alanine--tRNA ligase [Rhodohalobacter barkolensis]
MSLKTAAQIRREFLEFFKAKEHLIVDSAPVVPKNDPSLLFTNAGMNQFKPIFLGEQDGLKDDGKIWKRAADTQRCIRVSGKHNDLEEVGHDTYHHTLFEMLGNWSFGDYFKEQAIEWAWELLVDEWGLDPDRLYATVFEGDESDGLPADDESARLWVEKTSISPDHVLKFDKKDNFWEMGETGPCGPCSEVHVDLRSDDERKKKPGAELVNMDDPRVMEIWNLVFIQFNRQNDGSLVKLPAQHVDTGMGFERICAVLQRKTSNYDTDVFQPIIQKIADLAGKTYGDDEETDIAMRVIADHIRAVSFSIMDGASPSNEGRGYVIRRILRRAIRYGWDRLDFKKPFMSKLVPVLADQFADVFPELDGQIEYIQNVILAEEKSFLNTLGQGIELFNSMIEGKKKLSGDDAFKLHDTYGFPIDLTELMAREKGVEVDTDRFSELMKEQKERARAAGKFTASEKSDLEWTVIKDAESEFVGYDDVKTNTSILATAQRDDQKLILLQQTPFYAESGGQIADTGFIERGSEKLRVLDVQKSDKGHVHYVDQLPEDPSGEWIASIDIERRREIEKHHSATHIMHSALRDVLGDHVAQKGSLVAPDRLRFDFSHFESVKQEELDRIEQQVNEKIQENIPLLEERNVPIDQARDQGAMMLFGEKYGEQVRVITFDPNYSVELCGGTHVDATGRIGYFRFLSETSAAAGIRRVEAVTGKAADQKLRNEQRLLKQIQTVLGNQKDVLPGIQNLIEKNKELEKELEKLRQSQAGDSLDQILENGKEVSGVQLYTGKVDGADMDTLKQLGYDALEKMKSETVVVLASVDTEEGKVYIMAAVTDDLIQKGVKAGNMVSQLGRIVGGGGGGQPNLATAGGRFPEKIEEAFEKAEELIQSEL